MNIGTIQDTDTLKVRLRGRGRLGLRLDRLGGVAGAIARLREPRVQDLAARACVEQRYDWDANLERIGRLLVGDSATLRQRVRLTIAFSGLPALLVELRDIPADLLRDPIYDVIRDAIHPKEL